MREFWTITSPESSQVSVKLAESIELEGLNRQIHLYADGFRAFYRGERRSELQSPLFNVAARFAAGAWGDYDVLGWVFRELLRHRTAESVGLDMKRVGSRPGIFQLCGLLSSYLVARQESMLRAGMTEAGPFPFEKVGEMAFLFEAGRRMLKAARSDAHEFPRQAGGTLPLLSPEGQRALLTALTPPAPSELQWRRRFTASVAAYSFLFHGEMRDGIFAHGPYAGGDGRVLLVREFNDLHNDFFPWATELPALPATRILRALVVRGATATFDLVGNMVTDPVQLDEHIELDGMFFVEEGRLVPVRESDARDMEALLQASQPILFEHYMGWDDWQKIRYGALLHGNLLRGFWEMLPAALAQEMRSRAVVEYLAAADRHAEELLSRRVPLALEFMAGTAGEIFWPVVPVAIRDAGVPKREIA